MKHYTYESRQQKGLLWRQKIRRQGVWKKDMREVIKTPHWDTEERSIVLIWRLCGVKKKKAFKQTGSVLELNRQKNWANARQLLVGNVLYAVECLAISLASTHLMPFAPPCTKWWQLKTFLDIVTCPLGDKLNFPTPMGSNLSNPNPFMRQGNWVLRKLHNLLYGHTA